MTDCMTLQTTSETLQTCHTNTAQQTDRRVPAAQHKGKGLPRLFSLTAADCLLRVSQHPPLSNTLMTQRRPATQRSPDSGRSQEEQMVSVWLFFTEATEPSESGKARAEDRGGGATADSLICKSHTHFLQQWLFTNPPTTANHR